MTARYGKRTCSSVGSVHFANHAVTTYGINTILPRVCRCPSSA